MKFFILAALVAVAAASVQAPGPKASDQAPGPSERETNAILARAQHGVNHKALHYGAGVGAVPYYGNHGGYYGHGGYGYNGGYGYGGYGHGYNGYNGAYYGGYYGGHPAVYH